MDTRTSITPAEARAPEPAPEYAGDASANDGYGNPSGPGGGAPLPPRIIPEELGQVQAPEQGGDTGEGAAAHVPPGDGDGGGGDERLTGDYDKATQPQLDAEIAAREAEGREITVEGTGANGNVTNADRAAALTADDEARASQ